MNDASPLAPRPSTQASSSAMAEMARARIEGRTFVAMKVPRDMAALRANLLQKCRDPQFAENALYKVPVGGGQTVEDLSIRFAETVYAEIGNVEIGTEAVYEDAERRVLRATITDIQKNATTSRDITIDKTVERKQASSDRDPLSWRTNSYGEPVYVFQATEQEILTKESSQLSRIIRNELLRLLPADLKEECRAKIKETQKNTDQADLESRRKRLLDSFREVGVSLEDIAEFTGHDPTNRAATAPLPLSPDEIQELRKVYTAITEGQSTWRQQLEQKKGGAASGSASAQQGKAQHGGGQRSQQQSGRGRGKRGGRASQAKNAAKQAAQGQSSQQSGGRGSQPSQSQANQQSQGDQGQEPSQAESGQSGAEPYGEGQRRGQESAKQPSGGGAQQELGMPGSSSDAATEDSGSPESVGDQQLADMSIDELFRTLNELEDRKESGEDVQADITSVQDEIRSRQQQEGTA